MNASTALALGSRFTCALTETGVPYCWGWNGDGQLGSGAATEPQPTPVAVVGGLTFVPFHILRRLGVSDAANLALLVAVSLAVLLFAQKRVPEGRGADRLLLALPVAHHEPRQFIDGAAQLVGDFGHVVGNGIERPLLDGHSHVI